MQARHGGMKDKLEEEADQKVDLRRVFQKGIKTILPWLVMKMRTFGGKSVQEHVKRGWAEGDVTCRSPITWGWRKTIMILDGE